MAFLAHIGLADVVITGDSDILLYNVPAALLQYDPKTQEGRYISRDDVFATDFNNIDAQ